MQKIRLVPTFCLLVSVGILVGPLSSLRAQAPSVDSKLPAFDVASVKRNTSGSIVANLSVTEGRFVGTNLSVLDLLAAIFAPLPRSRVMGGPGWMSTDRFDIVARFEGNPPRDEILKMLQSLLVARFRLAVQAEKRNGDVYDLVLGRSDGRLGPMLRPSSVDCLAQRASGGSASATGAPAPNRSCASNYPGKFIGTGITVGTLVSALVVWADQRDVRDRTGLTGFYDVQLTWTPDRPLGPLPPNAPDEVVRAREAIDWNGPSLFTAVQEQLGLKLEPRADTVDVLVIDRLEPPTEN